MATAPLDSAAVAAVDSSAQVADILGLPDHLLDALWRVEAAALRPVDTPGGLVDRRHGRLGRRRRAGARGAGGRSSRARSSSRAARRCRRGPAPTTLVLCSSYSGNTEETLAAYDAAGAPGRRAWSARAAASWRAAPAATACRSSRCPAASSRAPRSATRSSSRSRWPRLAGAAPSPRAEVEAAAELARGAGRRVGARRRRGRRGQGARARGSHGTVPVIVGRRASRPPPPTAGSASSTRTPSCPRSRPSCPRPATTRSSAGPRRRAFAPFAAVFLDDPDAGERAALRVALTAEIVADQATHGRARRRRAARRASSG